MISASDNEVFESDYAEMCGILNVLMTDVGYVFIENKKKKQLRYRFLSLRGALECSMKPLIRFTVRRDVDGHSIFKCR